MALVLADDDPGDRHATACRRAAMARAARVIRPAVAGVSPIQQLLSAPASWGGVPGSGPSTVLRLRSPRRRGLAPACPDDLSGAARHRGTLVLFPAGFVLEPGDPRRPCINVARAAIRSATFYRDAFEVTVTVHGRLVVRTPAVEEADSVFQAYFWDRTA